MIRTFSAAHDNSYVIGVFDACRRVGESVCAPAETEFNTLQNFLLVFSCLPEALTPIESCFTATLVNHLNAWEIEEDGLVLPDALNQFSCDKGHESSKCTPAILRLSGK